MVFKEFLSQEKFKNRLHLVSVANPADHVEGSGPYLTLTSDGVINVLVAQVKNMGGYSPLPANFTNQNPKPGFFDHGFIDKYLYGEGSGDQILEYISKAFTELAQNKESEKEHDIEKQCWKWWERTKLGMKKRHEAQIRAQESRGHKPTRVQDPTQSPEHCYRYCITADVGMGDFYCNSHCEYLCHCHLDR